ncbi:hypothetical protein M8818_000794 [Zalaria obscura]|uniref:Uncharacterized protein n=1 Tax=Zalaria obscura TaxID=2024903 RepID=A0ACC3SQ01_9PEZI
MADHGPAVGMGSSSPDIMNDPAYQTNPTGEGKAPGEGDTCRICRSEGTPEEPLFYPCKCSGSIKFVHQDCLMEWLSHSNKKHCELCKTPFRFTKLYDSHMPDTLPTRVFIRKAFVHILRYLTTWARGGLVGLIWLIALPWCIRWAWRGLFWFTDAGWARDPFVARMEAAALQNASSNSLPDAFMGHAGSQPSSGHALGNSTAEPFTFSLVKMTIHLLLATGRWSSRNAPDQTAARLSPMAYSSILSDVDSVNDLTSSPLLNRMILDVMEGQIITLLVVVAFILVFLIREWVVQQQPILNAAAHAREDEVRIEELHDQAERLRNARNVIEQLAEAAREQNTGETAGSENDNDRTDISSAADFVGWDRLETYVLTQHQLAEAQTDRPHGDIEPEHVETAARDLARQLELVIDSGMEPGEAVRKIGNIIGKMPLQAQRIWLSALREHVQRQKLVFDAGSLTPTGEGSSSGANAEEPVVAEEGEGGEGVASHFGSFRVSARPSMRPREASSGAVRILQALEEEAGVDSSSTHHSQSDAESEDSWESHDSWQLPTPVSAASEPRSRDRTERLNTEKDKAPQGDHDTDHPNGLTKEGSMQDEGSWENRAAASEPSGVTEREEQSTDNHQPAQISGNEGTEHAEANDSHVGLPWGQAAGNESGEDDSWEDTFSEPSHAGGVAQPTERSEHQETANNPRAPTPPPQPAPPQGILQRMFDWFWADIVQNPAVGEPPVHGDEEIIQDAFEEAVFAPLGGNEEAEPALPEIDAQPGQDPEVLAAAAQAGLDPEAVEDAEDLEDLLLDTVTFVGSWALFWIVQLASSFIAVCIQAVYGQVTWNPLGSLTAPLYGICEKAATRLSGLFEPVAGGAPPGESAILLISIRAHESLQQLKGEVIAILSLLGAGLTSMGEHIQDMTGSTLLREVLLWAGNEVKYCAGHALWLYDQATTVLTHAFKTGKLTMNIEPATVTLDPSLAYWSATDRGLTVLAGYIFLAMLHKPTTGRKAFHGLPQTSWRRAKGDPYNQYRDAGLPAILRFAPGLRPASTVRQRHHRFTHCIRHALALALHFRPLVYWNMLYVPFRALRIDVSPDHAQRQPDEEGHHVRKSWSSLLGLKRGETDAPVIGEDRKLLADDRNTDVYFLRDGRYVRAPASDQVRIPKGHRVFLQVTEDNKRIDGKADQEYGIHGKEDPNFTKVYVPPWFRLRIALFLVGLWAFAATLGVSASVVPMGDSTLAGIFGACRRSMARLDKDGHTLEQKPGILL